MSNLPGSVSETIPIRCDDFTYEIEKYRHAGIVIEHEAISTISTEVVRLISRFNPILDDSMEKIQTQVGALNAASRHPKEKRVIEQLAATFVLAKGKATSGISAMRRTAEDGVRQFFRTGKIDANKDKGLKKLQDLLVSEYASFCQVVALKMWKLATEADRSMRNSVREIFPDYQFVRVAIDAKPAEAVEQYMQNVHVTDSEWKPANKATTITSIVTDLFAKLAQIKGMEENLQQLQIEMDKYIGHTVRNYLKHSSSKQPVSIVIAQLVRNIRIAESNLKAIGDFQRTRATNCLESVQKKQHIHVCFDDMVGKATALKNAALALDETAAMIVFESSTFEEIGN